MKKFIFNIIISFFFIVNLFGSHIIHEKVVESSSYLNCKIEAFTDFSEVEVQYFYLFYRTPDNNIFMQSPMISIGRSKYYSEIPANFMIKDSMEYYLVLGTLNGDVYTFPEFQAKENPISIKVLDPLDKRIPINPRDKKNFEIIGLDPNVVIISPDPGSDIRSRDCLVALSYLYEDNIDINKIKVFLDGTDVTNEAKIDSSYISLLKKNITPGLHKVIINLTNKYNQKFNDIVWDFTVLPNNVNNYGLIKKQQGDIVANYQKGNISGSKMGSTNLIFDYDIEFDWLQCDIKYNKSSLENEYSQPYDRFFVNLKNDFLDVKLGDSYPILDKYALAGHHVRGMNLKFAKGPIMLNMIKGNTKRAIQGNPIKGAVVAVVDSSLDSLIITLNRNNYTFQQELFAFKISTKVKNKFYFDINYIKVNDNVSTVVKNITNAYIDINTEDSNYNFRYDYLMDNYKNIFGDLTKVEFSSDNWMGMKPKDNIIYGSNIKFSFDDSKIIFSGGFSVSFLNSNKWNSIQDISSMDTLGIDQSLDGYFINAYQLNENIDLSQNTNLYSYGINQLPLVPFSLQSGSKNFFDYYNMSNLNRYVKLNFRYIGHGLEIGSLRNGPEYYSLLNPYINRNFSESYFSDKINLFENKLLLFFKRSKIIEGLYENQKLARETYKTLFNVSLFPGVNMPTLNLGFSSFKSDNNENKIIDEVDYSISDVLTTIKYIRREELSNNQLNVSISNELSFIGKHLINISAFLYNTEDIIMQSVDLDTLLLLDYQPKDMKTESYGINLKSIHNEYLESVIYVNSSYFNYGRVGFSNYMKTKSRHFQLNFIFSPKEKAIKYNVGTYYSSTWGGDRIDRYRSQLGFQTKFLNDFIYKMDLDYCFNFTNGNNPKTDTFLKISINYMIN